MTYFFVPNLTSEDLAIEDMEFNEYLIKNGWIGKVGEDNEIHLINDVSEMGSSGRGTVEKQDLVSEKV